MSPMVAYEPADVVRVYRDKSGHWRWRRNAPNGETLADSGEGYVHKADCVEIAKRVNTSATLFLVDDERDDQ